MTLDVGVMLPVSDPMGQGTADFAVAAELLEQIGVDSVWAGDHLSFHVPIVDPTVVLATAAAATERVALGYGVMLLALREPAWAAKQVGSLQAVSRGRVVLGIGVGGENPAEWDAVGVPTSERAARTDAVLEVLPDLLAGLPVRIPHPVDRDIPEVLPAAGAPPIWIGGRSDLALQRVARYGTGWLGIWSDSERVVRTKSLLMALAEDSGRPHPAIGQVVFCRVTATASGQEEARSFVSSQYKLPFERVERYVAMGTKEHVTDRLGRLAEAGVDQFVLFPAATDHLRQYELLSDVVAQLAPSGSSRSST